MGTEYPLYSTTTSAGLPLADFMVIVFSAEAPVTCGIFTVSAYVPFSTVNTTLPSIPPLSAAIASAKVLYLAALLLPIV